MYISIVFLHKTNSVYSSKKKKKLSGWREGDKGIFLKFFIFGSIFWRKEDKNGWEWSNIGDLKRKGGDLKHFKCTWWW